MNPFDSYSELDDEQGSRPVTCKRCGKSGLRWEDDDGEWILMEGQYKIHKCGATQLHRAVIDDFEAVK